MIIFSISNLSINCKDQIFKKLFICANTYWQSKVSNIESNWEIRYYSKINLVTIKKIKFYIIYQKFLNFNKNYNWFNF
jgi:hypothetical protein